MNKRVFFKSTAAAVAMLAFGVAQAATPVKFQLDWRAPGTPGELLRYALLQPGARHAAGGSHSRSCLQ